MPINWMDNHSPQSGGGCVLKLAGYDDTGIKKMGRWAPNSTSFL